MTRVDLDALEVKLNSAAGQDLIAESPIGELLLVLVAELRAARDVVDHARFHVHPIDRPCRLGNALTVYDQAVAS